MSNHHRGRAVYGTLWLVNILLWGPAMYGEQEKLNSIANYMLLAHDRRLIYIGPGASASVSLCIEVAYT